jgi:penicillin-binding protein activator
MKKHVLSVAVLGLAVGLSGCSAFKVSVDDKEPEKASTLTADYDQRDLLSWAKLMSGDILAAPFPKDASNPIMVVMGIQNRTTEHMDTKALEDSITTELMNSGKMRFVNASRRDDLLREQGYQLANCTQESRTAIGKQLGAKYMITGSLIEISQQSGREVRVNRKEDVYYQLTVEVTDLETGLMELRKQRDRLRRASKPIIGW